MSKRGLAIFDLDYTLYKGEDHLVILDFPNYLYEKGLFTEEALLGKDNEYQARIHGSRIHMSIQYA